MTTFSRALSALVAAWNGFFFRPTDLRVCALIRIAYAGLVIIWLAVLYPNLTQWYSEEGVLPLAVARKMMPGSGWTLLALWPHSHLWLVAAYGMALAHALLLLVGLGSRLNAAAVFVWLVSFCNRNTLILDSEDTVFRLIGFYLILMPCGACWSLDAWLFPVRNAECGMRNASGRQLRNLAPAWGLRLLQIQMCVIYFSAGLSKLSSSRWQDGTAMYYISGLTDYFDRFPTPDFLWQTPWVVRSITWSVMAAELLIPLLIWWRPARWWMLSAVLLFHLANEYTMFLFLFHWIMLVGWASFLTGDDLERVRRIFSVRAREGTLEIGSTD